MAVKLVSTMQKFIGLSSDAKPTSADINAGSEFYEYDTGLTYIYNGSAWSIK